jgi:hypothetical protein
MATQANYIGQYRLRALDGKTAPRTPVDIDQDPRLLDKFDQSTASWDSDKRLRDTTSSTSDEDLSTTDIELSFEGLSISYRPTSKQHQNKIIHRLRTRKQSEGQWLASEQGTFDKTLL